MGSHREREREMERETESVMKGIAALIETVTSVEMVKTFSGCFGPS